MTDTTKKQVRNVLLKLDSAAHLGKYPLGVPKAVDVLKLIEYNASLSAGGDLFQHVYDDA